MRFPTLGSSKLLGTMMIGTGGGMSAVVEISFLRICVHSIVPVCWGGRYYSLSTTGIGRFLGLLSFGRTVKAWEMVCVAGDLCLVRSLLSPA